MKINTKVVFEWNPESKQYEEIYCDSYDYDGVVDQCQTEEDERNEMVEIAPLSVLMSQNQQPGFYDSILSNLRRWQGQEISDDRPWGGIMTGLSTMMPGGKPFDIRSFIPSRSRPGGVNYQPRVGAIEPPMKYANIPQTISYTPTITAKDQTLFGEPVLRFDERLSLDETFELDPKIPERQSPKVSPGGKGAVGKLGGAMAIGGSILGGIGGYAQARGQQEGLSKAIKELSPIKSEAFGAYERMVDLSSAYRPGGSYSRYMGGKILSQAEELAAQETSRMIASGIISPSMMRQISAQSRRQAQASLPGMEMQISQMALPYEQLASGYFGQYKGLGEQLATLRGAKSAISPLASSISGMLGGAQVGSSIFDSLS